LASELPPHETEVERAALGCVLMASESQAEVDALLLQLRPQLFYDLRHRNLLVELTKLRMDGHALDMVTLHSWLKGREMDCGGSAYFSSHYDRVPSVQMFSEYLKQLKALARRRWALAESARLAERARNGDLDLADLRAEFSDALEKVEKDSAGETRLIPLLTIAELKAYVPEPRMFLIGSDMVSLAEITLLAGLPGIGKSRLARCLAFALARGTGHWMGYEVRRKARSLILQSEDSIRRIQSEVKDLPDDVGEWLRISAPTSLNFSSPQFRAELRRIWEDWPFDVLIIDPWSDVIRDEKFADMQEALENVLASLPGGDRRPAIVIVAHLKKQVLTERPMIGRQLLGQISGSFRIGQKARTVFVLQQVSMETDDDRVIFDCAKANNELPQPMSCWYRRNREFLPCHDFDFDAWLTPPEEGARSHKPEREDWAKIFSGGPAGMTKKTLADRLMQDRRCATASAYRWIDGAVKAGLLTEAAGVIGWKGEPDK
jgi:hypothetical protein